MTDRELLELAAKAMQNQEHPHFANYTVTDDGRSVCLELGSRRGAVTSYWKPLTDDGDALRLAVKLGVSFWQTNDCSVADHDRLGPKMREPYNGDPYAATRRAIVRAAAEIGKTI